MSTYGNNTGPLPRFCSPRETIVPQVRPPRLILEEQFEYRIRRSPRYGGVEVDWSDERATRRVGMKFLGVNKKRSEFSEGRYIYYRLRTMSRATFPLGPKGFCGLPFNSALTPPALPRVRMN